MLRKLEYKFYGEKSGNIITDVDVKSGTVKGYFSVFDFLDSDNDVVVKGAFKKTLAENVQRVKHLYQHKHDLILAGTRKGNLKVYEDNTGLAFESTITPTSYGKDVIMLYESGAIEEHSTGTFTIKSNNKNGYREITESMLLEGSTVTWGANEQAKGDVKSLLLSDMQTKHNTLEKLLRNGHFENEDVFEMLEFHIKQLQSLMLEKEQEAATMPQESTQPEANAEIKQALLLFHTKTF